MAELIEVKIKVDNRKTINSKFDSAMGLAMALVGELVEGNAKETCPWKSGNLRGSITHEETQSGTMYITQIGTEVKYGKYVECGTYKMGARPYLKPALANHTSQVGETIRRKLQNELKK